MESYYLHWDTFGYLVHQNEKTYFIHNGDVRKLPKDGELVFVDVFNVPEPKLYTNKKCEYFTLEKFRKKDWVEGFCIEEIKQ